VCGQSAISPPYSISKSTRTEIIIERELTERQQRGQDLICAADRAHIHWKFDTAARIADLTGDVSFYPIYRLCDFGHSFGQIFKALSKIALIIVSRSVSRHAEAVCRATGFTHDASPSLSVDGVSVGEASCADDSN
jgi:hypothetical protein